MNENDMLTNKSELKVLVYKSNEFAIIPVKGSDGAAAVDLNANLNLCENKFMCGAALHVDEETDELILSIEPRGRVLIPTGLHMQIPKGYKANVRPRSGLALKHGITVLNTPGLIDEDYRGDVGVILINTSSKEYLIRDNDRIAQLEIEKVIPFEFEEVSSLDHLTSTDRGEGGFGHTGNK